MQIKLKEGQGKGRQDDQREGEYHREDGIRRRKGKERRHNNTNGEEG